MRSRTNEKRTRTARSAPRISKNDLIGLDVAREPSRLRHRAVAPLVVAALISALFLVTLRVDVLRMRYRVADALKEEQLLRETQNELMVSVRELRDPARVAVKARELGFKRPERIIDLPDVAPSVSAPPATEDRP